MLTTVSWHNAVEWFSEPVGLTPSTGMGVAQVVWSWRLLTRKDSKYDTNEEHTAVNHLTLVHNVNSEAPQPHVGVPQVYPEDD